MIIKIIINIILFALFIYFISKYYDHKIYKENKRKYEYMYNKNTNTVTMVLKKEPTYDFSKYTTYKTIMTPTEFEFFNILKKITEENNLLLFSQVNMERLIKVIDNNYADRNRIKSRSIDYVIMNNNNKVICCIELDDYTHNYANVIKTDKFRNELFESVGIPLHRIKVNKKYNTDELIHIIRGDL